VPRLWTRSIEAHRDAVREAILDTTSRLAQAHGLRAVTMSKVAEETRIGRATLYKYFPDVDAILLAWHERQITHHLRDLTDASERYDQPGKRLDAVLEAYALIAHESRNHRDTELGAFLHGDSHVARGEDELRHLVRRLVVDAVNDGDVRDDVAPDELVSYCLHALIAARVAQSKAAVSRLVTVTLAGLRPAGRH
jgi:AcrR family transcriptional regulator